MPNLNKLKCKEKFLESIEGVDLEEVATLLKDNTLGLDTYTYFVTYGAIGSGEVDEGELRELVYKVYTDWYFLAKNNKTTKTAMSRLFDEYNYTPTTMTPKDAIELVASGKFESILPVGIQYLDRSEDKYFVTIDCGRLYGRNYNPQDMMARLYLNAPAGKLIEIVRELLDRVYMEDLTMNIKILNSDSRCDNLIIICDYEDVDRIVATIEDMKNDYPDKFAGMGEVSPILARVNDYIGFGEQPVNGQSYFADRCEALESVDRFASTHVLREKLLEGEQPIIFVKNGNRYTVTEYLLYLLERNALKLIDNKIERMENLEGGEVEELYRLYSIRDNVEGLGLDTQVNKLKKQITRGGEFHLALEGVGRDSYDYIDKLYRLFSDVDDDVTSVQKRREISSHLFSLTDNFEGINTREFLEDYFKVELVKALEEIVDEGMKDLKYARQSSILNNLKKKEYDKLKKIIKAILSDSDEGRDYVTDCIYDYARLLSTSALESVEIMVGDRPVTLGSSVNEDIISAIPSLRDDVQSMSVSSGFIDKILYIYGINSDNIAINSTTKDRCRTRRRRKEKEADREFYYTGY